MRNGEHSAVLEFVGYKFLNLLLCGQIDVSGGLIKYHDLVLSYDSPADANQGSLPR